MEDLKASLLELRCKYGVDMFNLAVTRLNDSYNEDYIKNKYRQLKDRTIANIKAGLPPDEVNDSIMLVNKITDFSYKNNTQFDDRYDDISISVSFDCKYKYSQHTYGGFGVEYDTKIVDISTSREIDITEFSKNLGLPDHFDWDDLNYVVSRFLTTEYPQYRDKISYCLDYYS
jgi:hypothetical protein